MLEEFDTSDPVVPGLDDDYFGVIVRAFLASGQGTQGLVGDARSVLVDAAAICSFAVAWLEHHDDRAQWTPFRGLDQLRNGIGHTLGPWRIGLVVSVVGVGLDLTRYRRNLAVGCKHGLIGGLRAR